MVNIHSIPAWFFGYDILLEIAFALISLTVALYAFKMYKLSDQESSKLFGFAFLFISISYFIQSFLNFAILSKLNENICTLMKVQSVDSFNVIGIYVHMIFFIIGLVTLAYMTFNLKNKKLYSILLILAILPILFSVNQLYVFYMISSLLLAYILIHYTSNYLGNRQTKTMMVLIAFLFLLFSNLHFIFSVNHSLYYVIGHFLELIAYSLILLNLILVFKNVKKKK